MTNKEEYKNKLYEFITGPAETTKIFFKNYNNMKDANTIGADKYFHALANCEAAQQASPTTAKGISLGRELVDGFIKNPFIKRMPLKENINDSLDDWNVDMYGLNQGVNNPGFSCRELVQKYRPNGLDEKY